MTEEIDHTILNTAIILEANGFRISRFNTGIFDWMKNVPWIEFGASGIEAQQKAVGEAYEAAYISVDQNNPRAPWSEESKALYEKYHEFRRQMEVKNLAEARRMMGYLQEFYANREVPLDRQLVVQPDVVDGDGRLLSQGATVIDSLDPHTKEQKLAEYQEEMRMFTLFLMSRYVGVVPEAAQVQGTEKTLVGEPVDTVNEESQIAQELKGLTQEPVPDAPQNEQQPPPKVVPMPKRPNIIQRIFRRAA